MSGPYRVFKIAKGDLDAPLGRTLQQDGVAVDLTGKTVEFKMVASDGTVTVDWTSSNVTIVTASEGKVQYDFQSGDVDTAGTFYYWFRVVASSETKTFPPDGRKAKIIITDTV